MGFVLANGVMLMLSTTLSDAQFAAWGWRCRSWAAGLLAAAAAGCAVRSRRAPVSLEMEDHARVPLAEVVRDHWRLVLLTAGGLAAGYAVFYAVTTWSLAYGVERLGVSRTRHAVLRHGGRGGPGLPHAHGGPSRRPLRGRRPLCLAGCTASALWMFPMIALLSTGEPLLMFLGFLVALLAFITMFAVIAAYLPELYEPRVRCTGAAVGYNLGGLGGALTPIVATAVAEENGCPGVAAYLTGIALFSLGCFALLPETRPVPRMAVAPATE